MNTFWPAIEEYILKTYIVCDLILLFPRKELNLLQKLYGLYDTVMGSISGYYEILWGDVDIEKINAELQEFQNRWVSIELTYLFIAPAFLRVLQVFHKLI